MYLSYLWQGGFGNLLIFYVGGKFNMLNKGRLIDDMDFLINVLNFYLATKVTTYELTDP